MEAIHIKLTDFVDDFLFLNIFNNLIEFASLKIKIDKCVGHVLLKVV